MKALDNKTLEAIAELICGDDGPVYRQGWKLPNFFRDAELKCPEHDGSTRKWWTLIRLQEYNQNPMNIKKIILRLANPYEYQGVSDGINDAVTQLNKILSIEGFRVVLEGVVPKIEAISPTILEKEIKSGKVAVHLPDFERLTNDPTLAIILNSRWKEIINCIEDNSHLAAIILMGSVLEGLLVSLISQKPADANRSKSAPKDNQGKIKKFGEWTFSDMINVASDCDWIQQDAKRFSHTLREYRNLVHPYEQRARNEIPDEDTCRICWEVVRAAINDIQNAI